MGAWGPGLALVGDPPLFVPTLTSYFSLNTFCGPELTVPQDHSFQLGTLGTSGKVFLLMNSSWLPWTATHWCVLWADQNRLSPLCRCAVFRRSEVAGGPALGSIPKLCLSCSSLGGTPQPSHQRLPRSSHAQSSKRWSDFVWWGHCSHSRHYPQKTFGSHISLWPPRHVLWTRPPGPFHMHVLPLPSYTYKDDLFNLRARLHIYAIKFRHSSLLDYLEIFTDICISITSHHSHIWYTPHLCLCWSQCKKIPSFALSPPDDTDPLESVLCTEVFACMAGDATRVLLL